MKKIFLLLFMLLLLKPAYSAPHFYISLRSSNGLYHVAENGGVSQISVTGISDAYIVKRYMNDQLLVSDHGGCNVLVLNQQGQTLRSTSISITTGVGFSSNGNIYYGSWSSSNIWEWTPTNQISVYATSATSIYGGIAVSEINGKNYVYAAHSTSVSKIDPVTKSYTNISIPGYSWPNLVNDTLGNIFAYGVYGSDSTITKISPDNSVTSFYTANTGYTIAGIDYSIWDGKYYVLEKNSSNGTFNIYTTTVAGGSKTLYMQNIAGITNTTQGGFVVFDNAVIPEAGSFLLLALGICFIKRKVL